MFDIHQFMSDLAAKRPIYHSEADFQHDFAWNFHQQFPDALVRLEYPVHIEQGKVIYLDLWFHTPSINIAIELKYKTRSLAIDHNDEHFHLKNHSAQDAGRYDFLWDVQRLERVKEKTPNVRGYAVLLTNESMYWKQGRLETIDRNFRLHEGSQLVGDLHWHRETKDGITKDRTEPIRLSRQYVAEWKTFSTLSAHTGGEFRYLIFNV